MGILNTRRAQFLARKWGERLAARAAADHSLEEGNEKATDALRMLTAADPTANKEYLDWLCRTYCAGAFLAEDGERVKNTLVLFHRWKHRLPEAERDIGRHGNEQSVWEAVAPFDPTRAQAEDAADPAGREKRRIERAKALAESEVLDEEGLGGWTVASPTTHFAAQWWGRGTRWCTSMKSSHYFQGYAARGRLWVFVDPDGNKFQAHPATASCADASDRGVSFDGLVARLPQPAVDVLRNDVRSMLSGMRPDGGPLSLSSSDLYRAIISVPRALVDEDVAEAFVKLGLSRITVRCEESDWRLLLVSDPLAKWAKGLPSGTSWHSPTVMILERGDVALAIADFSESVSAPYKAVAAALADAPEEFRKGVAVAVASLWEANNGYRSAAALSAFVDSLPFPLPQEAWVKIAQKRVKKPRDWYDLEVPHEHVDDEIADILAKGWSLRALPPCKVTKGRVMAFAAAHPELAAERIPSEAGVELDREIAMAIATARSGAGLQFVPDRFKDREFCLEVLGQHPRALKHVPVDYLTHAICCDVMDRSGILLPDVPARFLDEETCLRAVTQNGGMLSQVPPEFRTEAVCRAALASAPEQFVHADIPLRHDDYLRAVAVSGSLLARVPLAFRDEEMCLAALGKQGDAVAHVPPSVRKAIALRDPQIVGMNMKLSSRYPKSNPIHTFVPSDDRPDCLPPLRITGMSSGATAILTGDPLDEAPPPAPGL